MIYLADAADIAAFASYVNDGNATEGMHFYLQNDLTLLTAITGTFAGTLHGNGYSITLPTAGGSLFGDKLTGKVYNLGVPNGTIASTGTITNSFSKADDADELKYGKKAYDLSHYYTTENDPNNYVHTLFANNDGMGGDWRYGRTSAVNARYLRTAAPNYGNMQTSHNTEHKGDYELIPHDCLFFGQELKPDAEKKFPEHIDEEFSVNNWTEANRVYRTAGYYGSSENKGFHYNKVAWAMQPTLTAIDFTAENPESANRAEYFYGKTDDRPASLTSFNSDHNGIVSPYSNATTGKVTQNLLVYNGDNGNAVFKFKDLSTTTESDVQYHNILLNGTYSTDYLHLVDKQDFYAPIEFNVAQRAWYERKPAKYAEKGNDAWEGICLPFTVSKATASLNGEITHFYGTPAEAELADPATNFHTLHHEYWLRGLVSISSADEKTTATFQRPGTASTLFTQGTKYMSYEYQNTWFKDTYGELNYNYADPSDQNKWYKESHTYADYKPLEANIPYIVSFPGNRYYEFDLSSKFYNDKMGGSEDTQTITFSSGETVIPVTEAIQTTDTDNKYAHTGTFLHIDDAPYGIKEATDGKGTTFDDEVKAVLPFRTYMMPVSSSAKARRIVIGGNTEIITEDLSQEHGDPSEGEVNTDAMVIYSNDGNIIIESTYDANVCIYNTAGQLVRAVKVYEGSNIYTGFATGIYVLNGKKLLVK